MAGQEEDKNAHNFTTKVNPLRGETKSHFLLNPLTDYLLVYFLPPPPLNPGINSYPSVPRDPPTSQGSIIISAFCAVLESNLCGTLHL